eukprot:s1255_g22.t2
MSTAYYGRAVPLALRRFAKLPCRLHSPSRLRATDLLLPDGLPTGVHVVMLMTRRKHIEHADSWLGVRSACERLLAERGIALKGEMQMYICCLLPRFWPLRLIWRYRMRHWMKLLQEEEHTQVHILSCTTWAKGFFGKMQIHNDGRAHTMVIRNDGEILWAGHDRFQEKFQEREMVNVFKEESQLREEAKLLEGGGMEAIDSPKESDPLRESEDVTMLLSLPEFMGTIHGMPFPCGTGYLPDWHAFSELELTDGICQRNN